MDLVATHTNADFDALGSLVAARKLYPDARLLLPGSQQEAVREFLALAGEEVVVETEKECRLDNVGRLILVDTRQRSRIGIAAGLVDKGVEVHVYDHHPRMRGDVVADRDVYEEVGATVTILADIIRKKKIDLSYLEATLMLIGIYEETGSLTYRTTTRLDVDMVSFLLSQGASLPVVSRYLNRELSETELSLLTRLINTTERVTIKGVHVSFIELDERSYVGELGTLVHKLMEIENIPALFVLISSGAMRTDIIARSNVPLLDVNKVMAHFGGGGHSGAAGAKIRGREASTVRKELVEILKRSIKETLYAGDIMSKDVRTADSDDTIRAVRRTLVKEKRGGLPVVTGGKLAGIITLVSINKAIKSGFGHARVKGYMTRRVVTVRPDTPLYAIRKLVLERGAGVIPVISHGVIMGVIHRTDVLRTVHEGLFLKPHKMRRDIVRNLSKKMAALLPGDIMALLKRIGAAANASGLSAFVVGGMVRDLLLGRKNLDLDIVVEGPAIELGNALAKELGATIVIHRKFGTCSLYTKEKLKIDLATARRETYDKPAALPTVKFSPLKDDLVRRDFTINAMAVSINRNSFGQLIDFFGGERDLARARIRVLHDGSFLDDPTRIFRAVRFESRFGFAIDHHTEELIKNALGQSMFDKVEPQRIRDELVLIAQEREPLSSLRRMAELDELRFIHPKLKLDSDLVRLYASVDETLAWYGRSAFKKRAVDGWLIYLMALFDDLSYNTVSSICGRFVFRGSDRLRILSYKHAAKRVTTALGAAGAVAPSRIYRLLEPLSFEVTLLVMARAALQGRARSGRIRSRIRDFLQKYNGTRASVKGDDLKAMGLKPSRRFKEILAELVYAKIDGRVKTRQDEMEYVRRRAGKLCG